MSPDGPETIMALPPQPVTLCVVAGRKYAAIAVNASLRLTRLTWRNAAGQAFATTTRLPPYSYVQFQP
jgi:uncharacterized protein YigE (DUF2233 family)